MTAPNPLGTPTIGERQAIARITVDELRGMFGETLPIEAAAVLQTAASPAEARAKLAVLRVPTAKAPVAEQREAIARIVAPDVWRLIDHWRATANRPDLLQRIEEQSAPSLAQADAILSLTKNVATNADMRGALSNFLKWADRVQAGSAGVDYLNGDDGTGQDGWEDLDALRELARTVLQGDQS